MAADQGLKVERVLDAARAWRKLYETPAGIITREGTKRLLRDAIDALDAPVDRWTSRQVGSGEAMQVTLMDRGLALVWCRDQETANLALAALNAAERKP